MTKFNGTLLAVGSVVDYGADKFVVDSSRNLLEMGVANIDSGWGPNYSPSADEMRAYFNGWVMTTQESWGSAPVPYNGSGTKGWVRRWVNASQGTKMTVGSIGSWVNNSARSVLPTDISGDWTPYNLHYKLASPTVELIASEGQLVLTEGDNVIEVGSGIILREAAPILRTATAAAMGKGDPSWVISTANAYGNEKVRIEDSNYDETAVYTFTYLRLDKSPIASFTDSLSESEKAQLVDLIRNAGDTAARVSVLEAKKAEKDTPAWITPTLLNGWIQYNDGFSNLVYFKNALGQVIVRGLIRNGTQATVCKLPKGYRPSSTLIFPALYGGTSGRADIYADGSIVSQQDDGINWLSIQMTFQAEQ
ncbi:hypothetical protein [Saccharibacillus brassicae]|uniref:Uncharacterized protein n=1 Tax=Saccharibacillus brassicae TaxID=2583377 RepID=A0A4Y6US10_SACBS|nr:hypothetical protein [Saccharibacillus brassicae]QDH19550.1 hypothetical protein FFV09_00970 [Saccharibacillus brassicae]